MLVRIRNMQRNHYINYLLIIGTISVLFLAISCKSRQKTLKIDEVEQSKEIELDFPYDLLGYWKGELEIFSRTGNVQKIPMAMLIEETSDESTIGWQLIYNEKEKEDKRSYLLIIVDKESGHFQIDEDNGIILDAYLFKNKLVSSFSVQGSLLTVSYTFLEDDIIFEVIAGPVKPIHSTGNIKVGEASIPPVDSYETTAVQRATLKRIRG